MSTYWALSTYYSGFLIHIEPDMSSSVNLRLTTVGSLKQPATQYWFPFFMDKKCNGSQWKPKLFNCQNSEESKSFHFGVNYPFYCCDQFSQIHQRIFPWNLIIWYIKNNWVSKQISISLWVSHQIIYSNNSFKLFNCCLKAITIQLASTIWENYWEQWCLVPLKP